jgi:hypothetical protein
MGKFFKLIRMWLVVFLVISGGAPLYAQIVSTSNLRAVTWNVDTSVTMDSRSTADFTGNGLSFFRVNGQPRFGINLRGIPSESIHVQGVSRVYKPIFSEFLRSPSSTSIDWRLGGVQEITLRNSNLVLTLSAPPSVNFGILTNPGFPKVATTVLLLVRVQANSAAAITWSQSGFPNNPALIWRAGVPPVFNSGSREIVYPIFFNCTQSVSGNSIQVTYYGEY